MEVMSTLSLVVPDEGGFAVVTGAVGFGVLNAAEVSSDIDEGINDDVAEASTSLEVGRGLADQLSAEVVVSVSKVAKCVVVSCAVVDVKCAVVSVKVSTVVGDDIIILDSELPSVVIGSN